ncbi:stage V sporulation protein AE [Bacillus sp. FJAT-47783]|uniref:stage V sporulation protein AE n=1 Tax=Bacillus sp. FJAT-47783 TaxID=2922712 RepID=UPI001FAC1228|nr:stage V sporulation protein AE [Bacillus sp. FJAT-47783]
MEYVIAFVVGGLICIVGQLLLDFLKLTPAHVMSSFVVAGAILDGFGIYDQFIEFAGAGATVPITSFGHSILHGAMKEAEKHGLIGLGMGVFELTSAGISSAILFAFLIALIFKPKG